MRTFTKGTGTGRKFVVFEVIGPQLRVAQGGPDGGPKKTRKEMGSEAEARATCDRLVDDLLSRGYIERISPVAEKAMRARAAAAVAAVAEPKRSVRGAEPEPEQEEESPFADLFEGAREDSAGSVAAALPRLAPLPVAEAAPKKKAGKKKKRKKTEGGNDELDKRVIAGIAAGALGFVAFLGFLGHDMFFKPPSIVGTWGARGSTTRSAR